MTDITRLLASLKRRSSHVKDFGDDITFVKLEDLDALVEAMEKAQSANAAQDDHINQQQGRIEQLEKRNAELGKYAKELESFRTAYMEWSDKTDWVQGDKRFDVLIPWGKHRADVLKAYIERLESRTVTVKQFDEFQICHYGATEDYAKGYIDCQNNFFKWLTAAGIKWEAE